MPWTASRRWVFPSLRLNVSETRTPDDRWEKGYASRQYSESLFLAVSNGSWQPVSFALSFWRADASVFLELGFGGTLAGHESDEVRLFDHPGLNLPGLGNATSGDLYVLWSGWFEVYASGEMQVSAWNEIFDKGDTEQKGHTHVRTLDRFDASMPRDSGLDFPDVAGRPSVVWQGQRTQSPAPAPAPSEDARCAGLRETIASLSSDIADLQETLSTVESGERGGISARIVKLTAQRRAAIDQARALGCPAS